MQVITEQREMNHSDSALFVGFANWHHSTLFLSFANWHHSTLFLSFRDQHELEYIAILTV